MRKIGKKALACFLSLAMIFAFMPAMAGGQASAATLSKIGEYDFVGGTWGVDKADPSYTNNSSVVQYSKIHVGYDSTIYLKIKEPVDYSIYIYDDFDKLSSAAAAGSMTGYMAEYAQSSTGYEFELKAGDYYFATYRPYGSASSIKYDVYWRAAESNTSMASADSIDCGFDSGATSSAPTIHQATCGMDGCGSTGTLYWKFQVTDKAYYKLTSFSERYEFGASSSSSAYYRMKILDANGNVMKEYTSDPVNASQQGYVALNKGTYYIAAEAKAFTYSYGLLLNCYDFREIKSLAISSISGTPGQKLTLKYTASPSNFESTINAGGTLIHAGETATFAYPTPGKRTLTVKTSEGLSKSFTVTIKPVKMSIKGMSSEGTHNSTTLTWASSTYSYDIGGKYYPNEPNANYYRVYQYKSGKYVKVWQGSAKSTVTQSAKIKNLSANKTYSFKIAPCWKNSDGSIIEGPKSDVYKAVTAPSKKPVIKSAKATGTKYHKGTKTWHPGRYDAGGVWHAGYYTKNSAYSTASVKVKHTKVSGATSYASNGISFSKGIAGYKITGKVKAGKKQTVKIRTIKKNTKYNSVAYGPWSKSKTVKLKKAR